MTNHIEMHHANDRKGIIKKHRLWTAGLRGLPAFLVIGVEKGGTSSLAQYLTHHPQIAKPHAKEARFFLMHYNKGLNYYRANFPFKLMMNLRGKVSFDASPMYMFYPEVAENVRNSGLDLKYIALLRNPIDRAYSHYQMDKRNMERTGNPLLPEGASFADVVDTEIANWDSNRQFPYDEQHQRMQNHEFTYLARGYYAKQLKAWFDIFPREKFLIKQTEELDQSPQLVMKEVFEFLDLDPVSAAVADNFATKYHAFDYEPMSAQTREKLQKHFEPLNQELFDLLGVEYDW